MSTIRVGIHGFGRHVPTSCGTTVGDSSLHTSGYAGLAVA